MVSPRAYRKLTLSFFAEFLKSSLPVCLGLLDQPTSVGYRYGFNIFSLHLFSWKLKSPDFPNITLELYLLFAKAYNLTPINKGRGIKLRQNASNNENIKVAEF